MACDGRATICIVAAVDKIAAVLYAEIVASLAGKSAAPGTRATIDHNLSLGLANSIPAVKNGAIRIDAGLGAGGQEDMIADVALDFVRAHDGDENS